MLRGTLVAFALFVTMATALADDSWLGTWKSDWNGQIDTTLVVHGVASGKANITYSWAKTQYGPAGTVDYAVRVRGNKLSWTANGISFTFNKAGNSLSATRRAPNGTATGTFRKVN